MEIARKAGWSPLSSWGADGWDLGDWPLVVLSVRTRGGRFELLSVCEGDHDLYAFDTKPDLHAAIDYLFVWYQQSWERSPVTVDREALDAGLVTVDDRFRGPARFHLAEGVEG